MRDLLSAATVGASDCAGADPCAQFQACLDECADAYTCTRSSGLSVTQARDQRRVERLGVRGEMLGLQAMLDNGRLFLGAFECIARILDRLQQVTIGLVALAALCISEIVRWSSPSA